jgi:hypothetical protein
LALPSPRSGRQPHIASPSATLGEWTARDHSARVSSLSWGFMPASRAQGRVSGDPPSNAYSIRPRAGHGGPTSSVDFSDRPPRHGYPRARLAAKDLLTKRGVFVWRRLVLRPELLRLPSQSAWSALTPPDRVPPNGRFQPSQPRHDNAEAFHAAGPKHAPIRGRSRDEPQRPRALAPFREKRACRSIARAAARMRERCRRCEWSKAPARALIGRAKPLNGPSVSVGGAPDGARRRPVVLSGR